MSDNAPPPPPGDYPPPPPPSGYGAPTPGGYPGGQQGVPRPGELLDRFLARLIDSVLLGIVFAILFSVLGAILISNAHYDSNGNFHGAGSSILFYIVLGVFDVVVTMGYYSYMESTRGQTLGKMAMKLKVVGPDGVSNPTLEQAARRNIFNAWQLLYIIPIAGVFLAPLAGLAALVGMILIAVGINNDPVKRQAWHDQFAGGTQVLKIG